MNHPGIQNKSYLNLSSKDSNLGFRKIVGGVFLDEIFESSYVLPP